MAVDSDFARAIIQNIGVRWSKEEFCDLRITIGETVFSCSQFHLCACSEFFDVLLHPGLSTSKTTKFPEIRINGISPNIFDIVLHTIFKGQCYYINAYNMIDIWYASNHLQINFLIQKCETFIADQLTVENYSNIYPHALNLKSDFVMNKIVAIMASHFELLRHTQTFLDMSAQTLLKLVERRDFKSYDRVIDFIIQWVENEDREESTSNIMDRTCFKSISEDLPQSLKDSGEEFVEVIFRNEMLHPEVKTPMKRKDLMGTLMSSAQLNQASYSTLKSLLENDLVMDNREARNAVVKALDTVLELEKKVTTIKASENRAVAPLNISDKTHLLEPVVLFIKDQKIMAYKILTNQFFKISSDLQFEDILIYNNQVYAFTFHREHVIHTYNFCTILQDQTVDILCKGIAYRRDEHFIYNNSFLYKYESCYSEISRMKCTNQKGAGVWVSVGNLKRISSYSCPCQGMTTVNFKDYILTLFYIFNDNNEIYYVQYFDPNTRLSKITGGLSCEKSYLSTFVTFSFNESLFVLRSNGSLMEILQDKDGVIDLRLHSPLWDCFIRLYGAAVSEQILYIFADLTTEETLPTECQFGSIKFIQFLKNCGRCHLMKVCQNWLSQEV